MLWTVAHTTFMQLFDCTHYVQLLKLLMQRLHILGFGFKWTFIGWHQTIVYFLKLPKWFLELEWRTTRNVSLKSRFFSQCPHYLNKSASSIGLPLICSTKMIYIPCLLQGVATETKGFKHNMDVNFIIWTTCIISNVHHLNVILNDPDAV